METSEPDGGQVKLEADARPRRRDRAIIGAALATVVARVATAGAGFLALGFAARTMEAQEFGLVATLLSLWMVLVMFDIGIGGALVTRVAVADARGDMETLRGHVQAALISLTGIGSIIALTGLVAAFTLPWNRWIGGALPADTVVASVLVTFLAAGTAMPTAIGVLTLTGTQRMWQAKIWTACGGVLTLAAGVVAVEAGARPWAFILAMTGAPTLIGATLTFWIIRTEMPSVLKERDPRLTRVVSMLRASGYFAVINIGSALSLGSGTVITASALGPVQAAEFSVSSRLFGLLTSVIAAAGAQMWPAMTDAIARGEHEWVRSRYRRGLLLVGLITTIGSLVLIACGPWIAEVWVGPELVPPRSLFVWTAGFTVTFAVAAQTGVILMAVERVRALAALTTVTAATSLAASVTFATWFGLEGAMIGAFGAFLFVLLPGSALMARRALGQLRTPSARVSSSPCA